MRPIRALVIAAAVALVATAAVAATPMSPPKLTGKVGPGFTISLKRGTKLVKTLKTGRYKLVVTDKSNIHNFHLKGPGVRKVITAVGFTGTKTVTVTLKKGRYTYVCDVHPTMVGHFTVR